MAKNNHRLNFQKRGKYVATRTAAAPPLDRVLTSLLSFPLTVQFYNDLVSSTRPTGGLKPGLPWNMYSGLEHVIKDPLAVIGTRHGCQMAIARFLDCMCLALRASGLWLRYATLQNWIPSFPWIAPGWRAWGQILPSGNLGTRGMNSVSPSEVSSMSGGSNLSTARGYDATPTAPPPPTYRPPVLHSSDLVRGQRSPKPNWSVR